MVSLFTGTNRIISSSSCTITSIPQISSSSWTSWSSLIRLNTQFCLKFEYFLRFFSNFWAKIGVINRSNLRQSNLFLDVLRKNF
ncbi:hypothetical protein BpHYR1_031378 [Brachionus plicatilis]|uniref:Uncharacterized protein n=1 Tax=Brachionus plicatilis TaxID=10195 RepID=A0A3M7STG5_BRAPC|nr:hypothetical protein BpHYR1_031378 [Brachionus plicatilis]